MQPGGLSISLSLCLSTHLFAQETERPRGSALTAISQGLQRHSTAWWGTHRHSRPGMALQRVPGWPRGQTWLNSGLWVTEGQATSPCPEQTQPGAPPLHFSPQEL